MADEKQEAASEAQASEASGEKPTAASSEKTSGSARSLGVFSFEGDMPLAQAIPLGLQHVLAMFVGNLTPLFDRDGRVRSGGRRVRRRAAGAAAERHVDRWRGNLGPAVRHRPCWRQGAYHHGHVFGLHRRVQFRGRIDGRRPCCLRRHHGRFAHRRPVRGRARLLPEAAAPLLPVHRHGYRRAFHRLEPHQRRRERVRRRQQRG